MIPGLEPKQRFAPTSAPRSGFAGKPARAGERRGGNGGGGYGKHTGFGAKSFGPRDGARGGFGAPREGGFGGRDRDFGDRSRPAR